jgi:uncharacterized membrane protein YbaN (DUF454 family)
MCLPIVRRRGLIRHSIPAIEIAVRRTLYKPLGFLFLALAGLGIVLPLLPATPFILLSAWFFARSSERWHRWLLDSELFGPMIHNWEQNRCISCRVKVVAITSMTLAGGVSVFFAVEQLALKLLGLSLMTIGAVTVFSIKTCAAETNNNLD